METREQTTKPLFGSDPQPEAKNVELGCSSECVLSLCCVA
jgi:hypothetical protein